MASTEAGPSSAAPGNPSTTVVIAHSISFSELGRTGKTKSPCWFGEDVITIRPTKSSDLPIIQRIELAAGELFRAIGMTDIADHPVPTIEVLANYQREGRSWVAVDDADQPVGFILVKLVDARAHIEQVSIHPDDARRRIGRDLVDHVENWAAAQGIPALSLTTFRDVQWNGPYYERLGFAVLSPPDWGPELASLMADEAEHGLDPEHRIAMVRPIHQPQ